MHIIKRKLILKYFHETIITEKIKINLDMLSAYSFHNRILMFNVKTLILAELIKSTSRHKYARIYVQQLQNLSLIGLEKGLNISYRSSYSCQFVPI